jgi:ABC-type multidrug transport system ATPase subunit
MHNCASGQALARRIEVWPVERFVRRARHGDTVYCARKEGWLLRPPLLEIAGVSKTFGKSRVLSDISFSVGEAEVVGFVGPNGAGKTTTMKIMCGLLRADSGTVSLAGFDLSRQPRDFLLDEPMNGLDPAGMVKLREFIRSLCRDSGISVFISSHLLHEVEHRLSRPKGCWWRRARHGL